MIIFHKDIIPSNLVLANLEERDNVVLEARFENDPNQTITLSTTKKAATASSAVSKATSAAASTTKKAAASSVIKESSAAATSTKAAGSKAVSDATSTKSTAAKSVGGATSTALPSATAAKNESGGMSGGAIGGIIAAVIIILIGIVAYLLVRKRANRKKNLQMNNPRLSKADQFTFNNQPPMQQQQQPYQDTPYQDQYQHQYGTTTAPASDYGYNTNQSYQQQQPYQQQYQQQYQPSMANLDEHDHYQPGGLDPSHTKGIQDGYNTSLGPASTNTAPHINFSMDSAPPAAVASVAATTTTTAPIIAAAAAAAAAATTAPIIAAPTLMKPTQPGSLGVYLVVATYTPTLSDEIDIQTGDQVEILAEYDDGWCQGINLSRGNAKGVFPKHCTSLPNAPQPIQQVQQQNKRVSSMYIP